MKKRYNQKHILLFIFGFLVTIREARLHLFSSFRFLSLGFELIYVLFIIFLFLKTAIGFEYKKVFSGSLKFIIPLISVVLVRNIFLFISSKDLFIPYEMITSLMCIFIVVNIVTNSCEFKKLIQGFIFGSFLAALIPLLFYPNMMGKRITYVNEIKYTGGFWHSTFVIYLVSFWITVGILPEKYGIRKSFLYVAILSIFVGAFVGLSRTFIIAFVISFITFIIIKYGLKKSLIIIIISSISVILFASFIPDVALLYKNRLRFSLSELLGETRIKIWSTYLLNLRKYFLIGNPRNYKVYGYGGINGYGAHSVYINWLAQYGVFGLMSFLYLIYGLFLKIVSFGKNHLHEFASLMSWLVTYITVASINETGFSGNSLFLAIGIVFLWPINSFDKN